MQVDPAWAESIKLSAHIPWAEFFNPLTLIFGAEEFLGTNFTVVEIAKSIFLIVSSGSLPTRIGVKRLKNFQSIGTYFA